MVNDKKIRVLVAKAGCDIHERGAYALTYFLRDAGMEVIYTGRYQTEESIANIAMTEDVDLIALSDHTGSMPIIASSVIKELKKLGADHIDVVAGGLISDDDKKVLESMGVKGNYGPGTPMNTILECINDTINT